MHPTAIIGGPFRGSDAVRNGWLTKKQLRGREWRQLLRDVYLSADHPVDGVVRARAVSLVLPPGSVVSGPTAAWLHGGVPTATTDPIEVTLPRTASMGPRNGLRIRHALLASSDIAIIAGVPVTSAIRTGFDLARRRRPGSEHDLVESVVPIDALAHARRINAQDLLAYAQLHPGWRGVRLVADVVRLCDRGAESPMETRLRLKLVLGGLPAPATQYEIRDAAGRSVARVDLAYPELRIAIEFDGEHHRSIWANDLVRQNTIIGLGWTLLRYTGRDVYRRGTSIVTQVDAARQSALAA